MMAQPFDLSHPADNGLRRGFTTGTCATAAVKAAIIQLLCAEAPSRVEVTLPDHEHYLVVPIDHLEIEADGTVRVEVIKDGGDDPDQTHRARLVARVRKNRSGGIVFQRGKGVGLVTEPGLPLAVGEPAINPVPRAMMIQAIREILADQESSEAGFDVEIGCENGEEISKRTFNPRIGILGGISILGTTGIVEPKSMAAFQASIEIYIRVALGDRPREIVLAPGNLGQRFARSSLQVPLKQVVQMSNFVGFAFTCVTGVLRQLDYRLPKLWVVGHPGKLAKILAGSLDTHSQQSGSAIPALSRVARELGLASSVILEMEKANTVEHLIEILRPESIAPRFWQAVESRMVELIAKHVESVGEISVRLFQMDGTRLGERP